ncbi:MAG: sigma-70 family RNA polymerase sigma factor [bacterium]|nr:sigma-70 family RNA polymerase sigma factor [bacterium]
MLEALNQASDAELIARVKSGQADAFAEIVDRYKDCLVGYLCRLVGSQERAEDLAQEAFLRLYQRSDNYEERGQLKAYLFRIATNQVRSEERRAFRWDRIRSLLAPSNGGPPAQERTLLDDEARNELLKAIAALPLRYRTALVLHEIEGWRYRVISETLGCSEGTVKSRIHRGRTLLKRSLAAYWQGAS